jgi:ankyrin repeat protein
MAELTQADLDSLPSRYQSSRHIYDVLINEDHAAPLIAASATGDATTLRNLLSQPAWQKIALESPHVIYSDYSGAKWDGYSSRDVLAMPIMNLQRALLEASANSQTGAASILLDFASKYDVTGTDIIDRTVIKTTIEKGNAAILRLMIKKDRSVAWHDDFQGRMPLDMAIARRDPDMVAAIIEVGGEKHRLRNASRDQGRSYSSHPSQGGSRMCRAAQSGELAIVRSLVGIGYEVNGSGALQKAARNGALDIIRFLMEEHGADVNGVLPVETMGGGDRALMASWTLLHFAASNGRDDSMELLVEYGAKADVQDVNGKTPAQLLADRTERLRQSEAKAST